MDKFQKGDCSSGICNFGAEVTSVQSKAAASPERYTRSQAQGLALSGLAAHLHCARPGWVVHSPPSFHPQAGHPTHDESRQAAGTCSLFEEGSQVHSSVIVG